MAEEVVVKEILSNSMMVAGAELTRRLDQQSLTINASLWLYLEESNRWRLMIASLDARTYGPKKVYSQIQSILTEIPKGLPTIALKDISVVEDNHHIISLLRKAIRTGNDVSGIRFSNSSINGHFIEDAYIYRLT